MGSAQGKRGKNKQNVMNGTTRKEHRAMELRRAGHSFQEIADDIGYSSRSVAYNVVKRILEREVLLTDEEAILYKREEIDRLNELLKVLWPRKGESVIVSKVDKRGSWESSDDPNGDLYVIDRILKIMERRSKLLGLDAPTRGQVEQITVEYTLEQWLAEMEKEDD